MTQRIRPVEDRDLAALQDVERAAGRCFADIGMNFVAEDDPPSLARLREYATDGRAWVSTNHDDVPVAYILAEVVDGNAHVEQVSVHPDYAHRRIGRGLLDHLIEWAIARHLPAVTLTTYVEVPWNGPYYERCGFHYLTEEEETPGLHAIRTAELANGLDQWPRACMRRDL